MTLFELLFSRDINKLPAMERAALLSVLQKNQGLGPTRISSNERRLQREMWRRFAGDEFEIQPAQFSYNAGTARPFTLWQPDLTYTLEKLFIYSSNASPQNFGVGNGPQMLTPQVAADTPAGPDAMGEDTKFSGTVSTLATCPPWEPESTFELGPEKPFNVFAVAGVSGRIHFNLLLRKV